MVVSMAKPSLDLMDTARRVRDMVAPSNSSHTIGPKRAADTEALGLDLMIRSQRTE